MSDDTRRGREAGVLTTAAPSQMVRYTRGLTLGICVQSIEHDRGAARGATESRRQEQRARSPSRAAARARARSRFRCDATWGRRRPGAITRPVIEEMMVNECLMNQTKIPKRLRVNRVLTLTGLDSRQKRGKMCNPDGWKFSVVTWGPNCPCEKEVARSPVHPYRKGVDRKGVEEARRCRWLPNGTRETRKIVRFLTLLLLVCQQLQLIPSTRLNVSVPRRVTAGHG